MFGLVFVGKHGWAQPPVSTGRKTAKFQFKTEQMQLDLESLLLLGIDQTKVPPAFQLAHLPDTWRSMHMATGVMKWVLEVPKSVNNCTTDDISVRCSSIPQCRLVNNVYVGISEAIIIDLSWLWDDRTLKRVFADRGHLSSARLLIYMWNLWLSCLNIADISNYLYN